MVPFYQKVKNKLNWIIWKRYAERRYKRCLKSQIKNDGFSIISSNCWGGIIYADMGLEYKTPTAGLFFYAPCYLKFVKNLRENLFKNIEEVKISKYEEANSWRKLHNRFYPIGVLDDIEIHFLHYETFKEAVNSWQRRSNRVNFEKLFFAFNDKAGCTEEIMLDFIRLPFKKKVFFSAKNYPSYPEVIYIPEYQKRGEVGAADEGKLTFAKHFNIADWLNN